MDPIQGPPASPVDTTRRSARRPRDTRQQPGSTVEWAIRTASVPSPSRSVGAFRTGDSRPVPRIEVTMTVSSHRPRALLPSRIPLRTVALLIGLLLAVTGCQGAGPGDQQDGQASGPTVKVALIGDIDTFNPFIAILATSTDILRYQYEPLVSYGTNNEEVPGLAEEWQASDDARTWTYTIGADRKWSDGTPVTAEDAAYTFSMIKENDSLQQANGGLVTNVAEVHAVDDRTVELVLTAPQASNPGQELPIVPKHVWQEIDDPAEYPNDADSVGSGPFVITSSATGGTV